MQRSLSTRPAVPKSVTGGSPLSPPLPNVRDKHYYGTACDGKLRAVMGWYALQQGPQPPGTGAVLSGRATTHTSSSSTPSSTGTAECIVWMVYKGDVACRPGSESTKKRVDRGREGGGRQGRMQRQKGRGGVAPKRLCVHKLPRSHHGQRTFNGVMDACLVKEKNTTTQRTWEGANTPNCAVALPSAPCSEIHSAWGACSAPRVLGTSSELKRALGSPTKDPHHAATLLLRQCSRGAWPPRSTHTIVDGACFL